MYLEQLRRQPNGLRRGPGRALAALWMREHFITWADAAHRSESAAIWHGCMLSMDKRKKERKLVDNSQGEILGVQLAQLHDVILHSYISTRTRNSCPRVVLEAQEEDKIEPSKENIFQQVIHSQKSVHPSQVNTSA